MNETLQTILSRRSIRRYEPRQIEEEKLQAILQAGAFAPSAMNQQSWHFTVIQSEALLNRMIDTCKAMIAQSDNSTMKERASDIQSRGGNLFYNAPTLIIVSGNEHCLVPQIDCSLALGNMFLAARSLGLGSCWTHVITHLYASSMGKEFLHAQAGIPEGYAVVGAGVFGYAANEAPKAPPRRENSITFLR